MNQVLAAGSMGLTRHKPSFGLMGSTFMLSAILEVVLHARCHYRLPFLGFLAVLADSLKALAVGAPLAPTFRMVSPEPSLIRFFLAFMFA
jgi:hypothetical protein